MAKLALVVLLSLATFLITSERGQAESIALEGVDLQLCRRPSIVCVDTVDADRSQIYINTIKPPETNTAAGWRLALRSALREGHLLPDGDAFETILRLNRVTSFEGLVKLERAKVPALKVPFENEGRPLAIILDASLKSELLARLGAVSSRLTRELPTLFAKRWIDASHQDKLQTMGNAFMAYAQLIAARTRPLSTEFLEQIGKEADYIDALLRAIPEQGVRAIEFDPLFRTLSRDTERRIALFVELLGDSSATSINGGIAVEIPLITSEGQPVNNLYIYYASPALLTKVRRLERVTSPAHGIVPVASLCFWAVDPVDGQRVSDAFYWELPMPFPKTPLKIDIIAIGKQAVRGRQSFGICKI